MSDHCFRQPKAVVAKTVSDLRTSVKIRQLFCGTRINFVHRKAHNVPLVVTNAKMLQHWNRITHKPQKVEDQSVDNSVRQRVLLVDQHSKEKGIRTGIVHFGDLKKEANVCS